MAVETHLLHLPFHLFPHIMDLHAPADATVDSGLTFYSLPFPPDMDPVLPLRKRLRVDTSPNLQQHHQDLHDDFATPSFLPICTATSYLGHLHRQEILDVDRLASHHMERMRLELVERHRGFLLTAAAAVGWEALRRMKAKEEEVEQAKRLNDALEERVRTLSVEAQVWRALAESHEAAAQSLCRDLEDALNSHRQLHSGVGTDADAESCCDNGEEPEGWRRRKGVSWACKGCGEGEPSVLVLPCRHLCLCSACASRAQECPVCGCAKQCTVHVHLC